MDYMVFRELLSEGTPSEMIQLNIYFNTTEFKEATNSEQLELVDIMLDLIADLGREHRKVK